MANRKILISDSSGSKQELPSANLYYDDTANKMVVSSITASNLSSSYSSNGFISVNNGIISGSTAYVGASGSLLRFSGSFYADTQIYIGGDLNGSANTATKVISIANVASGVLPFANGGTGVGTQTRGLLIKGSGNTFSTLSTNNSSSVIGFFNSPSGPYWAIDDTDPTTNFKPRINVYTAGGYTWTKVGNPRTLKIIAVGGGGGGGGGRRHNNNGANGTAGGGGAGGGYSEVTMDAANVSSAAITVGAGGAGGRGAIGSPASSVNGVVGSAGGDTYVVFSSLAITASGGGGGAIIASTTSSAGQGNYVIQTQYGASSPNANGGTGGTGGNGYYTSGGGAGGRLIGGLGGAPGLVYFINKQGYSTESEFDGNEGVGSAALHTSYYLNNSATATSNLFFIGTGGSGGSANVTANTYPANNGGSGSRGSGGGGGGSTYATTTFPAYNGGAGAPGGDGYVIIYSY